MFSTVFLMFWCYNVSRSRCRLCLEVHLQCIGLPVPGPPSAIIASTLQPLKTPPYWNKHQSSLQRRSQPRSGFFCYYVTGSPGSVWDSQTGSLPCQFPSHKRVEVCSRIPDARLSGKSCKPEDCLSWEFVKCHAEELKWLFWWLKLPHKLPGSGFNINMLLRLIININIGIEFFFVWVLVLSIGIDYWVDCLHLATSFAIMSSRSWRAIPLFCAEGLYFSPTLKLTWDASSGHFEWAVKKTVCIGWSFGHEEPQCFLIYRKVPVIANCSCCHSTAFHVDNHSPPHIMLVDNQLEQVFKLVMV